MLDLALRYGRLAEHGQRAAVEQVASVGELAPAADPKVATGPEPPRPKSMNPRVPLTAPATCHYAKRKMKMFAAAAIARTPVYRLQADN
jgi:hypothetical protein